MHVNHLAILEEVFLRILETRLLEALIHAYPTLAVSLAFLFLILYLLVFLDDLLSGELLHGDFFPLIVWVLYIETIRPLWLRE